MQPFKANDPLIAETTPDRLPPRRAVTLPVEVYTDVRIQEFDEGEEELSRAFASSVRG
jgi:hypothetical protein